MDKPISEERIKSIVQSVANSHRDGYYITDSGLRVNEATDSLKELFDQAIASTREEIIEVLKETVISQGLNWSDFRNKMLEIDAKHAKK